jgi:hypothetical protein
MCLIKTNWPINEQGRAHVTVYDLFMSGEFLEFLKTVLVEKNLDIFCL